MHPMTGNHHPLLCISAHQPEAWNAWMDRVAHDFYHRAEYHRLAEQRGEGCAFLAVYGDEERFVAWPYLLVRLSGMAGLQFTDRCDVTSVYGYSGPLRRGSEADGRFFQQAGHAIHDLWLEQKAVSAFTRTHPLLNNAVCLEGLGTLIPGGHTVSMDLEISLEASWMEYRRSHRYEIRKGQQAGLRVYHDQEWRRLDEFVDLYDAAMRRKAATSRYLFDRKYFLDFHAALGRAGHLLLVLRGEDIVAGGIFTECCGIVQYHLSAIHEEHRNLAPAKILLDGARVWAKARGNKVLHLGGGVAGAEDSLFQFKSGMSSRRHDFVLWQSILDPVAYQNMVGEHQKYCAGHGLVAEKQDFFPAYRNSLVAVEQLSEVTH